ncbi:hypothetical protein [Ruegeria halocynthiae]|uniref:hypothetical protein n=1 Tax=Ruegeria halocynthiae TaxID=985054 RepID=UPI00055D9B53|nr:hypothetical protein [Ruegeria halocynthiae]
MESEARVLDESKLDSAIADLLREEEPDEPEPEVGPEKTHTAFPELPEQAEIDEEVQSGEIGLATALRQKWAGLRGAA